MNLPNGMAAPLLGLFLVALLAAAPSAADVIEVHPFVYCVGCPWTDQGLELVYESDNPQYPGLVEPGPDGVRLRYVALRIANAPAGVRSVSLQVKNLRDQEPVYLMAHFGMQLQDYVTSKAMNVWEILTLDTSAFEFDEVHISCAYATICPIVLRYGPVPVEGSTWGGVKALYGD